MKAKVNISIDEKVEATVRKMAEKESRNFSNMIEFLVRTHPEYQKAVEEKL